MLMFVLLPLHPFVQSARQSVSLLHHAAIFSETATQRTKWSEFWNASFRPKSALHRIVLNFIFTLNKVSHHIHSLSVLSIDVQSAIVIISVERLKYLWMTIKIVANIFFLSFLIITTTTPLIASVLFHFFDSRRACGGLRCTNQNWYFRNDRYYISFLQFGKSNQNWNR